MEPVQYEKGVRVVGTERMALGLELAKDYKAGESIRALSVKYGRSYGFVHRVLVEGRVMLRSRGGDQRTTRRTTQ